MAQASQLALAHGVAAQPRPPLARGSGTVAGGAGGVELGVVASGVAGAGRGGGAVQRRVTLHSPSGHDPSAAHSPRTTVCGPSRLANLSPRQKRVSTHVAPSPMGSAHSPSFSHAAAGAHPGLQPLWLPEGAGVAPGAHASGGQAGGRHVESITSAEAGAAESNETVSTRARRMAQR